MKRVVLQLDFCCDKVKREALMKTVAGLTGVYSIELDMQDKKLIVIGDMDPVIMVTKLRKLCSTDIVTVMPIKEPEKKAEPKKGEVVKLNQFRVYPNNYQRQQPPIQTYQLPPYMQQEQHPIYYSSVEEETIPSCVIC